MKILLINDYVIEFGGAEKIFFDTKNLLEEKGHIVKIFGSNKKGNIISFFSRWFSLKYYFKTKKIIEKFRPDIVHCHGFSRSISPSPILAAKKCDVPVIVTLHDFHMVCPKTWMIYRDKQPCKYGFGWKCVISNCYTQKMGIINFLYHWLKWLKVSLHRFLIKKYVDHFICPSKILVYWAKKNLKTDNSNYIPNFADIKINKIQKINEGNNQFLFVGRLSKEKGIDILIKAVKLVKEKFPDIEVKIIGDGPEKEDLENLTKRLNIQNNIKFLGEISNEKIPKYYQESLAIIMPSILVENCPLVALEAMKSKKPIIATDVGGFSEIIEQGKNGYLFEICNYRKLAEYIKKLYGNRELSTKLGNYGFMKLKKEFDKEKHYKKLETIYKYFNRKISKNKNLNIILID